MKKYDLILGAVYIIPVILGFMVFHALKNPSNRKIKAAETYFEELYKHPVRTVVIRNTDTFIRVHKLPDNVKKGFKLTGALSVNQISAWRISGDTLYFGNCYGKPGASLDLFVSPHVKIDTVNAPCVYLQQTIVEGNVTADGF